MMTIRLASLPLLFAMTLSACSDEQPDTAGEQETLTGTLTYLQRIGLPDNARVQVTLLDVSLAGAPATQLAEHAFITEGRQVPLPFSLSYDSNAINQAHRYAVRGEIRDDQGRLMWTTDRYHGVLTQGQPTGQVELVLKQVSDARALRPSPSATTRVYRCSPKNGAAFEFVTQYDQEKDELGLWLPDGFKLPYQLLAHSISASGARYQNDHAMIWSKGELARLEVGERVYQDCREDRRAGIREDARLRGVSFRATGNEPGWLLEITAGDKLSFSYNYGENTLIVPAFDAKHDKSAHQTRYQATTDTHRLSVIITEQACQDDMSGEPLPARVNIELNGHSYQGCGQSLD
ncbi:YbaY family lipoprotein [Zobellella maritima]|uniref:YbaY family lipoprotein n=1 Tax=Zobellella maritima TaxID=2059725 RepID=UPI0018E4E7C5|nr:YbaY family lipoprotein [Zobellella maritima]